MTVYLFSNRCRHLKYDQHVSRIQMILLRPRTILFETISQIEIVLVNVMEGWTMDHGPGPVGEQCRYASMYMNNELFSSSLPQIHSFREKQF